MWPGGDNDVNFFLLFDWDLNHIELIYFVYECCCRDQHTWLMQKNKRMKRITMFMFVYGKYPLYQHNLLFVVFIGRKKRFFADFKK
jgi:hypothetical protein